MYTDPEELKSTYAELTDEELIRLRDSNDLTENAFKILATELEQRHLSTSASPKIKSPKKIKKPKSIKVAVVFIIIYGILMLLEPILAGAPPYWVGQGVGVFILIAIISWALLRVKKYGWGFSIFVIFSQIAQLISLYLDYKKTITDPEELAGLFVGLTFYIALLLVALVALLLPSSRKPFKQLRQTQKRGS